MRGFTETFAHLCEEYRLWCLFHGFKQMSADELLCEIYDTATPEQKKYLSDFIIRWDRASQDEAEFFGL